MDTNLVANYVVLRGGNAALTPTSRLTPWDELPVFPLNGRIGRYWQAHPPPEVVCVGNRR